MDAEAIPDDVWITVFEAVDDSAALAILVRVSRRFQELASKPLLRELKWLRPEPTARNILAWDGAYRRLRPLTRKVTIGIPFEFAMGIRYPLLQLSAEMQLYDVIHRQLTLFPNLTEITFDGTVISPYTYTTLARIPTLQSLHFNNCTLARIHSSFQEYRDNNYSVQYRYFSRDYTSPPLAPPPPPFPLLTIRHLSLSRTSVPTDVEMTAYHPLCLVTVPNLTSLSISWTPAISARYGHGRWILQTLQTVDIDMPLLSRDLLDGLAAFIDRCPRGPRVRLKIEKHNMSEAQMGSVLVPLRGVWSFEGPLGIAACIATRGTEPTLTRVVMNEPLDLTPLLDGLEKLPKSVENLQVDVRYWDMEVLFAVKHLFTEIRQLSIRYIRGNLSKDFLVVLGADILAHLPKLNTLRILGITPRDDPVAAHLLKSLHPPPPTNQWQNGNHSHLYGPTHGHNPVGAFGISSRANVVLGHHAPHQQYSAPQYPFRQQYLQRSSLESEYDLTYDDEEELYDQQVIEATLQESLNDVPSSSATSPMVAGSPFSATTSAFGSVPPYSALTGSLDLLTSTTSNTSSSAQPRHPNPWRATSPSQTQTTQRSKSQWRDFARRRMIRQDLNHYNPTSPSVFSSAQPLLSNPSYVSPQPHNGSPNISPLNTVSEPTQTAQSDLGDYLIGWSRYCRSLRTVQIENGWWWERRFEGDRWVLQGENQPGRSGVMNSGSQNCSRKGKEKQTFPKGGFLP